MLSMQILSCRLSLHLELTSSCLQSKRKGSQPSKEGSKETGFQALLSVSKQMPQMAKVPSRAKTQARKQRSELYLDQASKWPRLLAQSLQSKPRITATYWSHFAMISIIQAEPKYIPNMMLAVKNLGNSHHISVVGGQNNSGPHNAKPAQFYYCLHQSKKMQCSDGRNLTPSNFNSFAKQCSYN